MSRRKHASREQPAPALRLVLRLALRDGLPLHVEGSLRAAAFERIDMIDHVAGTGESELRPVEGHGCSCLKAFLAKPLSLIPP